MEKGNVQHQAYWALYNCFVVRVRDPACVYKLATIDNVATVYIGHAGVRSSAPAVASDIHL